MPQAILRQLIVPALMSLTFASFGSGVLPNANCQAQDFEFPEDYEISDDPFWDDESERHEEFHADFEGGDFEDLPPAVQATVIIVGLLFFVAMIAIGIFILYLLYSLLKAIPPEYRLMEPVMVWLLLIPCFNIVWNFFVYPNIAKSYQRFFNAHGRTDVGDCGAAIGLWYAVCAVLVSIPCLNYFTGIICGPAMLVLMIIYLVRLWGLKKEIPSLGFSSPSAGPSPFAKPLQ